MHLTQLLNTALQALLRAPRFALTALATLALGIAALMTVAALAYAVLKAPLPLPNGERIVSITRLGWNQASVSLPDTMALRPRLSEFEAVSTVDVDFALDWLTPDGPRRLRGSLVEADYFDVLQVAPLLGRLTSAADDVAGAAPVAVLRESFWRRAFDADPTAIGRSLIVSGVGAEIIGVVPDSADLFEAGIDVYTPFPPFAPWALGSPGSNTFEMIGRVREGGSIAAARAQLRAVSADYAKAKGNEKDLDATAFIDLLTAPVRPALLVLLIAVSLMLLLVLANVVALLRVRTSRREAEWSTRAALGASSGALRSQLLAEACLLSLAAAVIGGVAAMALFAWMQATLGAALPRFAQAAFPVWLLALLPVIALFVGFAISSLSLQPSGGSRGGVSGSRKHVRGLRAMMVAEVAFAGALLGAALLLAQSFVALSSIPLGFDPAQVIGANVVLPEGEYSEKEPQSRAFAAMVESLQHSPGIEHAALVVGPLLVSDSISHSLMFDGGGEGGARFRPIIGDYFAALGIRVLAGIGSADVDAKGEPIAWINQSFAKTYFKDRDPLGARVAIPPGEAGPGDSPRWMRVVGIVGDVRGGGVREEEGPALYAPYLQREANWVRFGTLVARTRGEMANYRESLQSAIRAGAPNVPLGEASTMQALTEQALAQDRLMLQLIALFAAVAVLLALQGVFGVVSFAMQERRSELGLRMALGAAPAKATTLMLGEGARAIALGCLIALGLLYLVRDVLGNVLYGVTATDPATLAAALTLIATAALAAIWWPARRAAKLDIAALLLR